MYAFKVHKIEGKIKRQMWREREIDRERERMCEVGILILLNSLVS